MDVTVVLELGSPVSDFEVFEKNLAFCYCRERGKKKLTKSLGGTLR